MLFSMPPPPTGQVNVYNMLDLWNASNTLYNANTVPVVGYTKSTYTKAADQITVQKQN